MTSFSAKKLDTREWVAERRDNCLRIAASKTGKDRIGWIEDAEQFTRILEQLDSSTADGAARTKLMLKLAAAARDSGLTLWEAQQRITIEDLRDLISRS